MFKVDPEALRKYRLKQAHDNISFDSLDPEMCFEEEADENAESSGPLPLVVTELLGLMRAELKQSRSRKEKVPEILWEELMDLVETDYFQGCLFKSLQQSFAASSASLMDSIFGGS